MKIHYVMFSHTSIKVKKKKKKKDIALFVHEWQNEHYSTLITYIAQIHTRMGSYIPMRFNGTYKFMILFIYVSSFVKISNYILN